MKRTGSARPARRPRRATAPPGEPDAAVGLPLLQSLIGYNVRRAHIAIARDFQRSVGQGKVRAVEFSLLVMAQAQPGIAQVDLARKLSLDEASVVALIDRLEAGGLAERRRSPVDGRRRGLFVTPRGLLRLQLLKDEITRHERRFIERYTPAELARLVSLLQRMHE